MTTLLEQVEQIEAATKVRLSAIYTEIAFLRASVKYRKVDTNTVARVILLKQRRSNLDREISKINSFKEYLCKVKSEEQSVWAISDSLTTVEELRKFYMSFDYS